MVKSVYGDSRIPTGTMTRIIVNPQEAPLANGGGTGSGSGSGSGSASDKPPAYYINGATDALTRLINKNMNKVQINSFLENYRQMIAIQTNTKYTPTVLDSSITGLKTNQKDGKMEVTTADGNNNDRSGIVL